MGDGLYLGHHVARLIFASIPESLVASAVHGSARETVEKEMKRLESDVVNQSQKRVFTAVEITSHWRRTFDLHPVLCVGVGRLNRSRTPHHANVHPPPLRDHSLVLGTCSVPTNDLLSL